MTVISLNARIQPEVRDNLGAIHDVIIHKPSVKVAYAIVSFGGFLGIGNQYHPLPWPVLKYDPTLGGYVVNLDKRQLEGAPGYDVGTEPAWGDRSYESKIRDYYGVGPYWIPLNRPRGVFSRMSLASSLRTASGRARSP